jgi:hypothetical protein
VHAFFLGYVLDAENGIEYDEEARAALEAFRPALAQLEVLETKGWSTGPQAAWEAFLAGMERRQGKAADRLRSRGFLLALRNAALERRGRGVPEEVPDRLAEERARKWMWELLALRHRDIARAVAANLSRRTGHAREDLEQIAIVGIILAARR